VTTTCEVQLGEQTVRLMRPTTVRCWEVLYGSRVPSEIVFRAACLDACWPPGPGRPSTKEIDALDIRRRGQAMLEGLVSMDATPVQVMAAGLQAARLLQGLPPLGQKQIDGDPQLAADAELTRLRGEMRERMEAG